MTRVHHVNLVVPPGEAGAVAQFYATVFALAPIDRPGGDAGGRWLALGDDVQLHLSEKEGPPHPDAHIAVVVDDLDGVRGRLEAAGAEWHTADDVFGGGGRGFTRDPAGNRIEVLGQRR